ncbi:PREDICTED: protein gamma response 1-like [Tarenaya hassleriana]|uniref:protein gamma response 1-like n=1 Tax=Tarenaya hassleriana TaxID=28532 RepID=UPI00053C682E|nr:PREDICTED: protein gamma response 1-like [Tarenaya hassleriana]
MEEHLANSPRLDGIEARYISGLSTIMVATIQEAKDRISQIEYIFCSQLFPTLQSNSKPLKMVYSEARNAAEDSWKETEKGLLCEIEELKLQNQQILAENRALKLEKEKQSREFDSTSSLLLKVRTQHEKIEELTLELSKKSKEPDDGMEFYNRLVQVETPDLLNKEKQLKDHEKEINMLLSQVKSLERKTDFLQEELSRKSLVAENLLKKLESLSVESTNSEHKLSCLGEEKERLITRLQIFEENVRRLEELLRHKTDELEDGRKILEGYRKKLNLTEIELLEKKQQLADDEKEKKLLLEKVRTLEKEANKMHKQLGERGCKFLGERGEYEALCCQKEEKSPALALERKRRKEAYDAYKRLKSQYNFLCKRFGLSADSVLHQDLEDSFPEMEVSYLHLNLNQIERLFHCFSGTVPEKKNSDTSGPTRGAEIVRNNIASDDSREKERITETVQVLASSPLTISLPSAKNSLSDAKPASITGSQRPATSWRDTRSRQSPGVLDPHDDFLDTPFENIRKDLVIVRGEESQDLSDGKKHDSDKGTQDMNPNTSPTKKRIQVVGTSKRAFKYVTAVRKKSERENLKGIECKQCKKFYDAVLPENEGEETGGNKKSFRCEHHEGVSRHRYKHAPPMTPEGFWNIGFESEM